MYDDKKIKFIHIDCDEEYPKDVSIELNKSYSKLKKNAINLAKTNQCFICGRICESFCNSHTIPEFILSNISKNGKLYRASIITNIDPLHKTYGLNQISTFKLICRQCDSVFFQKYENENALSSIVDEFLLNEIALKNYLKEYYIKSVDVGLFSEIANETPLAKVQIEPSILDAKNAKYNIEKIKNMIKNQKSLFYKFFEIDLNYTVPIAFQSKITLSTDLHGRIINNLYNFDTEYKLKDIHICIFPLKSKTKILMFVEQGDKRYRKFIKQFLNLSLKEQLEIVNYIIFLYSDEIYISTEINEKVFNNKNLKYVSSITTNYKYSQNTPIKTSELIKEINVKYNLSNRINIPNFLSEKYKINKCN